jgi:hypothetical protein
LATTAATVIALNLVGCASPAKPEAMTLTPSSMATVNTRLKGALSLREVSGGEATNPLWASQVDNAGLKRRCRTALPLMVTLQQIQRQQNTPFQPSFSSWTSPCLE